MRSIRRRFREGVAQRVARGLCRRHYKRQRAGRPLVDESGGRWMAVALHMREAPIQSADRGLLDTRVGG